MSVVLVIAVGMFFLRDNIAKFINNAAIQIASEESGDGLNEYGFYFGRRYSDGYGTSVVFYEDGSVKVYSSGNVVAEYPPGSYSYSNNHATMGNGGHTFIENGTAFEDSFLTWRLEE